jgi:hypothetical protein
MKESMRMHGLTAVTLVAGMLASLQVASAQDKMAPIQQRHLSGFASYELEEHQAQRQTGANALAAPLANVPNFLPVRLSDPVQYVDCDQNIGNNIKVNQNCLNLTDSDLQGRGQANNETAIAQDPNNPLHMVASDNDYRRGDGNCYTSYSRDGGHTWTDSTVPMGFVRGTNFGGVAREYFQAGGDTSVAWDTKGNAYLGCQMFQRGTPTTNNPDFSSGIYVFRSTQNNGASWNFPGRPAVEDFDATGATLLDKPYMTVDNHVGSPFQDRVYVTYTFYAADGSAYIYEVHSDDYGQTFSAPVVVSGNNTTLCTNTFGLGTPNGNCNENQFSDPFTGPDGALYVVFNNYNNPTASASDNHNQFLLAKSTDGGATFSTPVLVANYYDLPDCATYQGGQDAGRACMPEKGVSMNSVFRATNYSSGAVSPKNAKVVAVTFGSYINVHSNESNGCVPTGFAPSGNNAYTGVKTPGACNNKILLSVSTNGGASFTGGTTDPRSLPTVNQASGQNGTDQWWQWEAFTPGGALAVSYYDRQYGSDETTGSNDVSASWSGDLVHFATARATSSSMPSPTQFPDAQGNSVFFGDYTGLSAAAGVHPIWMDTRSKDLFLCPGTGAPGIPPAVCTGAEPNGLTANDQEIYTVTLFNQNQQ